MTSLPQQLELAARLAEVAGRIAALQSESPNETKTRYTIIDPILDALGWDTRNPLLVEPEYTTLTGKPVDYALMNDAGEPQVFIEAKKLHSSLESDGDAAQIIAYAATDGVEQCVLTNGRVWKVYNTLQPGKAPQKLVRSVTIEVPVSSLESLIGAAADLEMLRRDQMPVSVDGCATVLSDDNNLVKSNRETIVGDGNEIAGRLLARWKNVPENIKALYKAIIEFCNDLAPNELELYSVNRYDGCRFKGGDRICVFKPQKKNVFLWTVCRAPLIHPLPAYARRYPGTAQEPDAIRIYVASPEHMVFAKDRIRFAYARVKQG